MKGSKATSGPCWAINGLDESLGGMEARAAGGGGVEGAEAPQVYPAAMSDFGLDCLNERRDDGGGKFRSSDER
jgi:hypothetical protein